MGYQIAQVSLYQKGNGKARISFRASKKPFTFFLLQKDERARDTATMTVASKQQKVKSRLEAEKDDHRHNMKKLVQQKN